MRDDLSDFDGTPEEFCHLAEAMRGVRDWLRSDSGWGRQEPIVDPAPTISDQPGIEKEHTEVKRKPSSTAPGYAVNGGKKSHHKPAPIRKCVETGCEFMLSGTSPRCPEHRLARRKRMQGAAQKVCYLRNKAAKQASA